MKTPAILLIALIGGFATVTQAQPGMDDMGGGPGGMGGMGGMDYYAA